MENITVAKGQVYKLVSGGPWMTVTGISEYSQQVYFVYFHKGVPQTWNMPICDVPSCLIRKKVI